MEAAPYFHEFLTAKQYRLNADFNDVQGRKLRDYDEKKIADLIDRMPMTKWSGSAKGGLVTFDDKLFSLDLSPSIGHQRILYDWTKEIAEYRLHAYFERKATTRN